MGEYQQCKETASESQMPVTTFLSNCQQPKKPARIFMPRRIRMDDLEDAPPIFGNLKLKAITERIQVPASRLKPIAKPRFPF